jgi:hypothetical protein
MALLKHMLLWSFITLTCIPFAQAEDLQLQEREIQAGLLYNFLKYTNWPENKLSGDNLTLCIIGSDPFHGRLNSLSNRTVNRHAIVIKQLRTASDAAGCHLAVVGGTEGSLWKEINAVATHHNILTASTESGFSRNGGMIEFGRNGSKISVKLNITNVKQAKLDVAGRMLKLVTLVN